MKGVKSFIGEFLWPPFAGGWTILTGLASILAWSGVSENWSSGTKILVGVVTPLSALLIYLFWVAYSFYTASTKVYRPLRVRRVLPGTHYFQGEMIVILVVRQSLITG